jgi:hypothetical protein
MTFQLLAVIRKTPVFLLLLFNSQLMPGLAAPNSYEKQHLLNPSVPPNWEQPLMLQLTVPSFVVPGGEF